MLDAKAFQFLYVAFLFVAAFIDCFSAIVRDAPSPVVHIKWLGFVSKLSMTWNDHESGFENLLKVSEGTIGLMVLLKTRLRQTAKPVTWWTFGDFGGYYTLSASPFYQ